MNIAYTANGNLYDVHELLQGYSLASYAPRTADSMPRTTNTLGLN